ncbi:MAG TPA: fused MFS/spermidine synthase [Rhodocyclaceae bacterium]|nr:fused MFS/spermidine synthase [Rhodocyclaceae bacterium]
MKKPFSTPLLYVTAGISGALVMVVEILGARIISPFFGVSLFIWTALISVTLLALAAGYIVGGRLADRFPTAQGLFGLIAGAGSWLILIPSIKAPIVELALMLGLRAGAFFSALALFGPALFMLGCVSPWLMRLLASSIDRIGATSGRLYGLSTVGSFVGSALTGFYLLGEVGVNLALYASGGILSTLALLHFAYVRDPRGWLVLLGLSPLLWSPLRSPSHIGAVLEDGTTATLISVKDSYHGSVRVVDYSMNRNGTREMIIDGLVQGGVDRSSGLSIYEYSYMLEHLPLSIRPQGKSCLTIGLGAGIVPRNLAARGIDTDVVEINPAVLEAAIEHFDFPTRIPVTLEDARTYIARPGPRYDYILMDAFTGDTTPGYLLSLEALQQLKRRLTADGVVGLNIIGSMNQDSGMLPSIVATLRRVFIEVRLFPVFAVRAGEPLQGNFILLASDGPLTNPGVGSEIRIHSLAAQARPWLNQSGIEIDSRRATILTDDFNSLDVRDLPLKESVRRNVLQATPRAILM